MATQTTAHLDGGSDTRRDQHQQACLLIQQEQEDDHSAEAAPEHWGQREGAEGAMTPLTHKPECAQLPYTHAPAHAQPTSTTPCPAHTPAHVQSLPYIHLHV